MPDHTGQYTVAFRSTGAAPPRTPPETPQLYAEFPEWADEATSDFDGAAGHHIMEAVERLREQRKLILNVHRLSTARNRDRLFSLEDGSLDAVSIYDELLAENQGSQAIAAA